jgi:mono/diheme cytochrome c family protein
MLRWYCILPMLLCANVAYADTPSPAAIEFFEKRIRPVLADNCHSCHGPKKQSAGLRLDSAEGLHQGSDNGPILLRGQPDKSLLIEVIRYEGDTKMPPKAKLLPEQIADLTQWVKMGAPWPASKKSDTVVSDFTKHWAFQPIKGQGGSDRTIESLAWKQLRAKGMSPAPRADRYTLIRRATVDLHGLPPTFEEVQAFINDPAPDDAAFAEVVDRLLASPRFGERWCRYWLDHARYADDKGYIGVNVDRSYPFAWTYRDWVVRALNEDMPYDRFVMLQLAADHVVTGDDKRDLAALGFLTVGRRFINNQHDIIDDRIDTVSRTFLGLTVACARCHDHKYDPIPTQDYYSLYGVFASSREPEEPGQMPLLGMKQSGPVFEAFTKELAQREAALAKFEKDNAEMKKDRPREFEEKVKPFQNRIKELYRHPGAPPRAMVLLDNKRPIQPHVFLRGNPGNRGPAVPRQFLGFLEGEKRKPFTNGSGRLELAKAIVRPDNPLTARVMANRVWLHLFGQGLVRTPSDFGLRSDPPDHPELLDHLALQFREDGWSVKRLIRRIMLSQVYSQASSPPAQGEAGDPENRLLGRMNRRRLDLEATRDALLFVSGQVDMTVGGPSVNVFGLDATSNRRTLYGLIDRQNLPGLLRTFDFAIPDQHSPQRFTTTVPQQALHFLNSDFTRKQAKHLIARPDVQTVTDSSERIRLLYRLTYGRQPATEEVQVGRRFVTEAQAGKQPPWEQYAQVLLMANEFVFVD